MYILQSLKKRLEKPLFKAGNKLSCGNYRLISPSIILSKNFEKYASNLEFLISFKKNPSLKIYNFVLEQFYLQMIHCLKVLTLLEIILTKYIK